MLRTCWQHRSDSGHVRRLRKQILSDPTAPTPATPCLERQRCDARYHRLCNVVCNLPYLFVDRPHAYVAYRVADAGEAPKASEPGTGTPDNTVLTRAAADPWARAPGPGTRTQDVVEFAGFVRAEAEANLREGPRQASLERERERAGAGTGPISVCTRVAHAARYGDVRCVCAQVCAWIRSLPVVFSVPVHGMSLSAGQGCSCQWRAPHGRTSQYLLGNVLRMLPLSSLGPVCYLLFRVVRRAYNTISSGAPVRICVHDRVYQVRSGQSARICSGSDTCRPSMERNGSNAASEHKKT
ncbi:hypothetical protein C8Q80DRAFT_214655 [Daedaleopsis nitida]|nr:hypothetical protein C8Q80DRAFT_214655 [Daedaleopsis nitida]